MSYYDFDEHFWSAEEVCGQAQEYNQNKKPFFCSRIISCIFAAFSSKKLDEKSPQNSVLLLKNTIKPVKSNKPAD